jgi:hypothetical protein
MIVEPFRLPENAFPLHCLGFDAKPPKLEFGMQVAETGQIRNSGPANCTNDPFRNSLSQVLIVYPALQNGRRQCEHQAWFAIAKKILSTRFHLKTE